LLTPLILLIIAFIIFFAGILTTIVGFSEPFWEPKRDVLVLLGLIAICLGVVLMLYAGALALPKTYSNATYVPIPIPIFLK